MTNTEMTFATATGTGVALLAREDVERVLRLHGFVSIEDAAASHVTSICLGCQSITVSPDARTREVMHNEFDLSCCDVTVLI